MTGFRRGLETLAANIADQLSTDGGVLAAVQTGKHKRPTELEQVESSTSEATTL